jgi:hypothetical protein
MSKFNQKKEGRWITVALLLFSFFAHAQSTDQTFKNIPQQAKQTGETKAVTKTNTVAGNAADQLDTLSNKAFRGFTGLFKKKKNPKTNNTKNDSTASLKADSTKIPAKTTTGMVNPINTIYPGVAFYRLLYMRNALADDAELNPEARKIS